MGHAWTVWLDPLPLTKEEKAVLWHRLQAFIRAHPLPPFATKQVTLHRGFFPGLVLAGFIVERMAVVLLLCLMILLAGLHAAQVLLTSFELLLSG
jgi:hypothetical protein